MPYKIVKRGNEYSVVNKSTGKCRGMSPTRSKAKKHMAAMYAAESKRRK